MDGTITSGGATSPATMEKITSALSAGTFFWLDLVVAHRPEVHAPAPRTSGSGSEIDALLSDTFHFHPITVEDAATFGQRPKLEDFDDYTYVVVHGATPKGTGTVELHLFLTEHYVVTLHADPCPQLDDVRERVHNHHSSGAAPAPIVLLYLIVDSLTDSFFPALSQFDDQVDTLESSILQKPTDEQLGQIFAMKRTLLAIRKVITPQRDLFAALSDGITEIPGMTDESSRYFRDLYDHLIRISDLVDSYRDLLSGVMDTHLSTVSNRLNVVMKQLTIIATIFLPLSFLTGFFGQNFAWLVQRITGLGAFLVLAVGTEVAAAALLMVWFWKRGWLGGPTA